MKKISIVITFLLLCLNINAQTLEPEFSFQLYFEDAAGSRDTVTIGYDSMAADTISAIFGEVNLIDEPWSSNKFQVKITDKMPNHYKSIPFDTFRTKKRIVKKNCGLHWSYFERFYMDFKNAAFPVTITFDYDDFMENDCIKGSIISTIESSMLWDGGGFASNMIHTHGKIIVDTVGSASHHDLPTTETLDYCHYKDSDNKIIYSIWLQFSTEYVKPIDINSIDEYSKDDVFSVSPNPFAESFTIEAISSYEHIKLYNLLGNEIEIHRDGDMLTPLINSSGIYYLSISLNGKPYNIKIIKK